MRISDWSSDVCSSDLAGGQPGEYLEIEYAKGDRLYVPVAQLHLVSRYSGASPETAPLHSLGGEQWTKARRKAAEKVRDVAAELLDIQARSEEHTSELQSLMRISYAVFCLKKKNNYTAHK